MKTALLKVSILGLLTTALIGCSGGNKLKSEGSLTTPPPPTDGGGTTPPPETGTGGQVTWPYPSGGDTVSFVPVSWEEMNQYVAIRPLNNPSKPMININMNKVAGTQFYAGKVQIGYTDSSNFYYGSFSAGTGKNVDCPRCRDNGLYEAAPNYWSTVNGKMTFMAYVQDLYGSLIIVMEKDSTGADGEAGTLKGRIYYRNFANSVYPQEAARKCWYIYSGPYACYSHNMSQKVRSDDFSDGTYRLLGYFSGVRSNVALGQ